MNALAHSASRAPWGRRIGWVVMTLLATFIALVSSRYFTLDPDSFLPEQKAVFLAHEGPLLFHVTGGVLALVLGPWQFVGRLRTRRPLVHRWLGRVYLVSMLLAGVGGLLLAPTALGGWISASGFSMLGVLLIATSAQAYASIRRGQVARHRAWMTRSYALIFTAVTFRLWISLFATVMPFDEAYRSGAWSSWILNLLVAEWLILRNLRGAGAASDPVDGPQGRVRATSPS